MPCKCLLDYLAFTVKTDPNGSIRASVTSDDVFGMLGLDRENFVDCGPVCNYMSKHIYNGISVLEPYPETSISQGWHIILSGSALRFYEQLKGKGNKDFWRDQLRKWRTYNALGFYIHPSRLDIASDDDSGILTIQEIREAAVSRDFVSLFRNVPLSVREYSELSESGGETITFGNRQSSAYLRIYDKLAEQRRKYKNDPDELERLSFYDHWIRVEMEWKNNNAIKMWNLICDSDNFGIDYAEALNSYIRFIDRDDSNISRCSVKKWWFQFLGTVNRVRLTTSDFVSFSYRKTVNYFKKYLTSTLFVVLSNMDIGEFFGNVQAAGCRLRPKQRAIIYGEGRDETYTAKQIWDFLNPSPNFGYAV